MMGKSLLKSLLGAGMIGFGFIGLPVYLTFAVGSTILNGIFPSGILTLLAGLSSIGIVIMLAMLYFGFKFVNENQTPLGNFLIGAVGIITIIVGILVAIGAVSGGATAALAVVGIGVIAGGFSLVDYGFKTKTIPAVSNVYKRI